MKEMQVKYIFLQKNSIEGSRDLSVFMAPFKKMFIVLFENVTDYSFDIQVDDKYCTVRYKYSSKIRGNTCYLTLVAEGTLFQCAKVLNEANSKLIKGSHRKNYSIILSFDGVSNYYCNRIYPKFNLFERKIRELIFCILVEAFGINWYDATVSDTLKTEIKKNGMNQSNLIEKALYEMTIFQLETYLFTPYRELDMYTILEDKLNQKNIYNKSKDEIIDILDKCRARSLWDRFFEGKIQIADLQANLKKIRDYRNDVAHCKHFYNDDYIICNRLLNKVIGQLNKTINDIEIRTFSRIDIGVSLSVLSEAIGLFQKNISDIMTPTMKSISEMLAQISKLPKIQFDIPKIDPKVFSQFNALMNIPKFNYELLSHALLKGKDKDTEEDPSTSQDNEIIE